MAVQQARSLVDEAEERARRLLDGLRPERVEFQRLDIVAVDKRVVAYRDEVYAEKVYYLRGGWRVVVRHYTMKSILGKQRPTDERIEYVEHGCTGVS